MDTQEDDRLEFVPELTVYAEKKLKAEYKQASKYATIESKVDGQFYCRRASDYKLQNLGNMEDTTSPWHVRVAARATYLLPNYQRTRILKVFSHEGKDFVKCSCPFGRRYGLACRHVYSLLRRAPGREDAIVRWHQHYTQRYGRCKKWTKLLNSIREKQLTMAFPVNVSQIRTTPLDCPLSIN